MGKQRIFYWDNLKAILIFLVVLSHFLLPALEEGRLIQVSHYFIYLFHMPAFVFVTGFFAKRYIEKGNIQISKLTGYLLLYVIFKLIILVTKSVLAQELVKVDFLRDSGAPWYLLGMFFWFLFLPLFAKLRPAISICIALLISVICGMVPGVGDFLCLSRTIVFFPFFLAGYYYKGENIEKITSKNTRVLSIITLALIMVAVILGWSVIEKYGDIIYGGANYKALGFSLGLGIVLRLVWYAIASLMTLSIMSLIPKDKNMLSFIGERTLAIYILHRVVRQIFDELYLYKYFNENQYVVFIGCMIISLVVTYVCSAKIINDFFHNILNIGKSKKKI